MALSGSNFVATGTYWRVVLEWNATQNISGNYSDVTARLYWQDTGSNTGVISSASKTGSITVDGTRTTFSGSGLAGLSRNQKKLLKTVNKRVYHNSDGTKSFSLSGTFDMAVTLSGVHYASRTVSISATLNPIPRLSTISTLANFTIGNNPAITYAIAATGLKYDLLATMNGRAIQSWTNLTSLPSSLAFSTAAQDLMYNEMRSSTSGTLRVTLITYSSTGTRMGTFYRDSTASVGTSIVPVINTVTLAEAVSGLNAQFAAYVQGKSRLSVAVTASGAKGSTIRSYSIVANGTTYTSASFTTSQLRNSGSNTITIEVTDTRGRKASTTRTITVLPYSNPSITLLDVVRTNSTGTPLADGTFAKVTYKANVDSVGTKNTKVFQVQHKRSIDSTWITTNLTVSGYVADGSVILPSISGDHQYDVRLRVTDYFTTVMNDTFLSTAFTLVNFHPSGKSLAIGGVMQKTDGLDIMMPTDFSEIPSVGNVSMFNSGSNANGSFLKLPDGTLFCAVETIVLSTVTGTGTSARLTGTWTLPTGFIGTPVVSANVITRSNGAVEAITHIRASRASTTAYTITVAKNSGTTAEAFTSGDTVTVSAFAMGRWK